MRFYVNAVQAIRPCGPLVIRKRYVREMDSKKQSKNSSQYII